MAENILSKLAFRPKENWREALAERVRFTTPIAYWCHLFDNFTYEPGEFYALVMHHLQERAVPDLLTDYVLLQESTVFSKQRKYLELRRERFVFQICAAPFGRGWFVSSRLFDRRKGAGLLEFMVVGGLLLGATVGLWQAFGFLIAVLALVTVLVLLWVLMRLAAKKSAARLDECLCSVPCLGPIYQTFFHPETYFRQDQRNMYREAVHRAVMAALGDLHTDKGLQSLSAAESQPVLQEWKGH